MKKILFLPLAIVFSISILFTSCLNNDDDNKVDEGWKAYQTSLFQKVTTDVTNYDTLVSQSANGFIMWQNSSVITNSDLLQKTSVQGYPVFTDSVVVRYEGWYYDMSNKIQIFDSTENPSLSNASNPNKVERQFAVSSVVDGFSTALQKMTVGQEKLIVIPQQLGYKSSATSYIPAYTTLYFRIKLINIVPMKSHS